MAGRKKHPNSPNATVAVRISERAFLKLKEMRQGEEPYGWTFERAIDILKKLRALEDVNRAFKERTLDTNEANEELIKILKKRDKEIAELKAQRKAMHAYVSEG